MKWKQVWDCESFGIRMLKVFLNIGYGKSFLITGKIFLLLHKHFFWLLSKSRLIAHHRLTTVLSSPDVSLLICCSDKACDHYYMSACDYLQGKACESWPEWVMKKIIWSQINAYCRIKRYVPIWCRRWSETDVLVNMKYRLIWSYWTSLLFAMIYWFSWQEVQQS